MKTIFLIAILALAVNAKLSGELESIDITPKHPEALLEFMDYVKYFNYPVEEHFITTKV